MFVRKLLLLSFLASFAAVADEVDPCQNALNVANYGECDPLLGCSALDRKLVLCEMRDRFVKQYALLHQKEKRLSTADKPFRFVEHFNGCIKKEEAITDRDAITFFDRVLECLAPLKDSHLEPEGAVPQPNVFTGFRVYEVDGKFYIGSRMTGLIELIRDSQSLKDIETTLAIGNEITEVDGRPIKDVRDELMRYEIASSLPYAEWGATKAIFERNYRYPKERTVEIKVKSAKTERTVRLPWWTHQTKRHDVHKLLRDRNIQPTDVVAWSPNPVTKKWEYSSELKRDGYRIDYSIVPDKEKKRLEIYEGSDAMANQDVVRMGIFVHDKAKAYAYLQILSFQPKKLKKEGTTDVVDFMEPIENFLEECEAKNIPLILDLRFNPGGQMKHPTELVSRLMKPKEKFSGVGLAFRTTAHTGKMLALASGGPETVARYGNILTEDLLDDITPVAFDLFRDAVKAKKAHTDIVFGKPTTNPEDWKGFTGKIVVLTTSNCMSACDITAGLLKRSGRGKLVGTPTNGTGVGFAYWDAVNSRWMDSSNVIQLRIPNFLFGVPQKAHDEASVPFEKFEDEILSENRPSPVDIEYRLSLEEIKGEKQGWLNKALEALK